MRRASGESSTRTQDTPVAHLWFTTGPRHHEADSGKLLSGETVMAARPVLRLRPLLSGRSPFVGVVALSFCGIFLSVFDPPTAFATWCPIFRSEAHVSVCLALVTFLPQCSPNGFERHVF